VEWLRTHGIHAAGQSSWGPAVFAIAKDNDQAAWFVRNITTYFSLAPEEVVITTADNQGVRVWTE
jgi:predicted sugar kinase